MATAAEVFDKASQIQQTATTRVRDRAEEIDGILEQTTEIETGFFALSNDLSVPKLLLELASISTDTGSVTAQATHGTPEVPEDLTAVLKVPEPAPVSLEPVNIPDMVLESLEAASYSTYSEPPPLPEYTAGRPNLNYPEAGFITVDDSAGLRTINTPNIQVGATPAFLDIAPLNYDLSDVEVMQVDEPDLPDLPDLELLSSPQRLAHTIDEDVVDALIDGMEGEPVLSTHEQGLIRKQPQTLKDIEFDRAERALVDQTAAAGFASFTGPLIHRISFLVQDYSYQDRGLFEAARDEAHKRALQHVTTSVKNAIRLELANAAMHFEYAARIAETLKINVAMQVEYANILVGLFNEQLKVLRAKIAAYNEYVTTAVSKYEAEIRAELSKRAILDTNEGKLRVYGAQIETLQQQARAYGIEVEHDTQPIEEYRTYIQGLLKNVEIVRTNIGAMQEALRVYGEAVDSDRAKLAAYSAQIRATGSATDVYSANWRTFSEYVQAYSAQSSAARTWAESNLQNIRSVVSLYEAQANTHRQYEQEREQQVQRIGSLKDSYVQAIGAYVEEVTRHNRAESALDGADDEAALLAAENSARSQLLEARRVAAQARIDLGLATAQATSKAASAQAAQSILSYTASYGGSASASGSATETDSVNFSDSASRTYRFTTTRTA